MSGAQILPAEQYFERFAPNTSRLAGEPIDSLFIAPKTLNSFAKSRDGFDLRRKSGDRRTGVRKPGVRFIRKIKHRLFIESTAVGPLTARGSGWKGWKSDPRD